MCILNIILYTLVVQCILILIQQHSLDIVVNLFIQHLMENYRQEREREKNKKYKNHSSVIRLRLDEK